MGQALRTRTRSTISVASTASPKSTSLSMQNCLASPSLPSSMSRWCGVSFMVMGQVPSGGAGNRDGGLLADFGCVDLNPVAGLDGRDRILVEAVHGRDFTGNRSADVDVVDLLADDAGGAVMGLLALEVQADGAA